MFRVTKNHLTTVLTLAALLAAVFFSTGQAEAGTMMPPWKKKMMQNAAYALNVPPAPAANSDSEIELVEEVQGPAEEQNQGNDNPEGHAGQTPGNGTPGKTPAAAPTPSAVAGGIAMLGLIAGRRRRQTENA